ncbi:MAG: dihydroorotate dehydrogenase electron transfer subunit [bacterium]
MHHKKIKILANIEIAPAYYRMILKDLEISNEALPGQFIHVRVSDDLHPLLRRPFSLYRISKEDQFIEILYQIVGQGTLLLSKKRRDEYLDVIGPIGRGFWLEKPTQEALLVAGGVGIAPLFALAEKLLKEDLPSHKIIFFLGAKSKDSLIGLDELRNLGIKVEVTTKDGSVGYDGVVSTLLKIHLSQKKVISKSQIFSCGPLPMLKVVSQIAAKHNLPCQVSLEERMGCGIGACLGCVVKVREKGSSAEDYERVCVNGPVFNADEVVWE